MQTEEILAVRIWNNPAPHSQITRNKRTHRNVFRKAGNKNLQSVLPASLAITPRIQSMMGDNKTPSPHSKRP